MYMYIYIYIYMYIYIYIHTQYIQKAALLADRVAAARAQQYVLRSQVNTTNRIYYYYYYLTGNRICTMLTILS